MQLPIKNFADNVTADTKQICILSLGKISLIPVVVKTLTMK